MSQNEKTREGRKEGTHTQAHTHTHTHTYPCGFESEDTIQRPGRTVNVPVRRRQGGGEGGREGGREGRKNLPLRLRERRYHTEAR